MDEFQDLGKQKKHSSWTIPVILVVVFVCAWFVVWRMDNPFGPKTMTVTFDDGTTEEVVIKEANNIKKYVEIVNYVDNNDFKLLTGFNQESIVYKDKTGVSYIKTVSNPSEYVGTINYLYYNDEYTIEYSLIPHYVIYTE